MPSTNAHLYLQRPISSPSVPNPTIIHAPSLYHRPTAYKQTKACERKLLTDLNTTKIQSRLLNLQICIHLLDHSQDSLDPSHIRGTLLDFIWKLRLIKANSIPVQLPNLDAQVEVGRCRLGLESHLLEETQRCSLCLSLRLRLGIDFCLDVLEFLVLRVQIECSPSEVAL